MLPLPHRWRLRGSRSPPVHLWSRRRGSGAHGGQSTGAPASGSPGGTHGALHPPRPRVLHLSISKRQRGPHHPSSRPPHLRPTLGRPRTDGPPLPTLPQQGQARPSRGQTRGCTSHLLSAHRSGPQVKPSQVPKACVLGCGSVPRARPWGSPRLCPLQGGRHRVPPGQMTSAGGRSWGLEVSPCLLQWGPRLASEPLTFTGIRRTFERNH